MTVKSKLVPAAEYMLVTVEDIDIPNRIAHVRDQTGVITQISFNYQYGGLTFIPNLGEVWRAARHGFKWYLEDRVDSREEFLEGSAMEPGDARIAASQFDLNIESSYLNHRPIGSTIVDVFHSIPPSGHTSVTLTHEPVSAEVIHATLNGLIVVDSVWDYLPETRSVQFIHEMGYGYLQVTYETWQRFSDDSAIISGKGYIGGEEEYVPA